MATVSGTTELLALTGRLAAQLRGRSVRLMEVCGTHTMAISRMGLRTVMSENVKLTSGPGCPVCVTSTGYIDTAIDLAGRPDVIVTTFGDMMRVPGSAMSLSETTSQGARVEVVYSPVAALGAARANPDSEVVFLGVGFETTAPAVAACIRQAQRQKLSNFSVLVAHKLIPPAMRALLTDADVTVDGFMCPGHVSVIIGSDAYRFVSEEYAVPCVVTGFEPVNVITGVNMLLRQLIDGRAEVESEYKAVVKPEGNVKARKLLEETFEVSDTPWRGLGVIARSGLVLADEFADFDAERRFDISIPTEEPVTDCRCGDVMRGVIEPEECALFARTCRPESPVGPCMVSSEGVCAAHYRYERR